nr:hypothetical protein [Tissierella sp.]
MTSYRTIKQDYEAYEYRDLDGEIKSVNREWIELLKLLERINPCSQSYELADDCLIVSYKFKLNILNFKGCLPLRLKMEVIGLPISISHQGYFGDSHMVKNLVEGRKGLKLILNSDSKFENGGATLSSFIFLNRFKSFDDYIFSLRSSYRRRINKALKAGKDIAIKKIDNKDFTKEHYNLYLSIMRRTKDPLETLDIEFFKRYKSEIYEFIDRPSGRLVGFIQLKQIDQELLFLFGGFHKEDNKDNDLYYNMLLKIIRIGIERKVKTIEFGQTAEETKLKIGCKEKKKYLYIHHSNRLINFFLKSLVPRFSYKFYPKEHKVFKD